MKLYIFQALKCLTCRRCKVIFFILTNVRIIKIQRNYIFLHEEKNFFSFYILWTCGFLVFIQVPWKIHIALSCLRPPKALQRFCVILALKFKERFARDIKYRTKEIASYPPTLFDYGYPLVALLKISSTKTFSPSKELFIFYHSLYMRERKNVYVSKM